VLTGFAFKVTDDVNACFKGLQCRCDVNMMLYIGACENQDGEKGFKSYH